MRSRIWPALILFPALALVAGCEGPQGPPGEGVGDLDTEPPTVSLRIEEAQGSATIAVDEFDVSATASDNRGVSFVEFFFDGSKLMGEVTASDSTAPYTWTWNLEALGKGFGTYPLIARAIDTSRNAADSAPLLVHYVSLPDEQLLEYFGVGDPTYFTIPDGFGDRFFNVRFSPAAACSLKEVHFYWIEPTNAQIIGPDGSNEPMLQGGTDVQVYVWNSRTGNIPELPALDSVFVAQDAMLYDQWTVLDVSALSLAFGTGEDFHAGYSLPASANYDQLASIPRATPIRADNNPNLVTPASSHRSGEFDPSAGWGSVQSHWPFRLDFYIRALVQYDEGETALIVPEPVLAGPWRETVELPPAGKR